MKKLNITNPLYILGFMALVFNSCNTKYKVWVGNDSQKIYNLKYGEHKRQKMDVFLPANYAKTDPVILIVHGGAWKYGKKEHMIHIQKMLFENNIPSININYRLVSRNITYKNQLDDIGLAVEKFNSLSEKAELTPNNYIILGESAGGHLALLYGYRNSDKIKKIISLSGPTDFYSEEYLNSFYSRYTSSTIQKMVGTKLDRKQLSEEFKIASPIANITHVPTLLFQGNRDFLVNYRQGLALESLLQEKEIPHQLVFMKNTGHTPRFFNHKKRDSIIYPNILNWIKK